MTIIKKNPNISIAFFCGRQLVGHCFYIQDSSNRSTAKNIARERSRENIHTEELLYPSLHHPSPTRPHPCPWRHYTGTCKTNRQTNVVQWDEGWSAVSVWRHHNDSMCSKFEMDLGFFQGFSSRTRHGCGHTARWKEERLIEGGQPAQITSGCWSNAAVWWLVFLASGSG